MDGESAGKDRAFSPIRVVLKRSPALRGMLMTGNGRVGLALVAVILVLAVAGPFLSPYSPVDTVAAPYEAPGAAHWLGADSLGRDALARYLNGGRDLVVVAFLSTALAYLAGLPIGMLAGYRLGSFDLAATSIADLILSFPAIIFILVLVAALGPSLSVIVLGIAVINLPRVVRIARTVTTELLNREFVEAAVARGEQVHEILRRDILPNIWTPILADFGIRLTGSIILFSSLSYLGFGRPPPAPDWGLMISENRFGIFVQPWLVVVPALTIALLAIGVNLIADAIARALGHSGTANDG